VTSRAQRPRHGDEAKRLPCSAIRSSMTKLAENPAISPSGLAGSSTKVIALPAVKHGRIARFLLCSAGEFSASGALFSLVGI